MPHSMTRHRTLLLSVAAGSLAVCLACSSGPTAAATHPSSALHAGGTSTDELGGCPVYPRNNYWNAPITELAVSGHSDAWMSHMSPDSLLHPDFGPSYGQQPIPYGIPITVVDASHAKVPVTFQYRDESDRVPYPLGSDTKIEGGWRSSGDRHALVLDTSTCELYETWHTRLVDGTWHAGSGATWDLGSNALRRDGWTSADAAGLPILPGLLRLHEVEVAGLVTHAIRFTTDVTRERHIWPARHDAGSTTSTGYPPMGARFRLKASFPLTGYRADTVVVLEAMKTYGLVLADNGSPWFFGGTSERGWPSGLLDELKTIPAKAFEAVNTRALEVRRNSGATR